MDIRNITGRTKRANTNIRAATTNMEEMGGSLETADGDTDDREAGWRHLIDHIQDAVVEFELVDGEPIIRGVNGAFVDVFGYDRDELIGASLNEYIVPDWLADEAATLDARTASGEINHRRVKRRTADGLREFLYRSVPYTDDRRDGFAVYTDLTDITQQERQLRVLNRVLRHNLRNKVTVISGHATRLQERLEGEDAEEYASVIEDAARDLRSLTTEATQIHGLLRSEDRDTGIVDTVPVIRELVSEYRERHPDAEIAVGLPETAPVRATTEIRTAIESLVENAIEHNPAALPRVRILVEPFQEDWTDVVVEDDGPMIPDSERDVVTGAVDITPTRHGSGLGLWLVKWTAERFGGELTFGESDLGGNSVRIRLQTNSGE
jgi:PAS domain S-box-containing protein